MCTGFVAVSLAGVEGGLGVVVFWVVVVALAGVEGGLGWRLFGGLCVPCVFVVLIRVWLLPIVPMLLSFVSLPLVSGRIFTVAVPLVCGLLSVCLVWIEVGVECS